MEPVNNLRDAMSQAGRFGHVESVQGDDHVSYQVRKGFGNWLVHVVKWYSNKGYKKRIIEQRKTVLNSLDKHCGSHNPPGAQGSQSFSDRRVQELSGHLRHGLKFQAGSLFILNTTPEMVTENHVVAGKLIGSHFRTDDAALKNLIIPGRENDSHPHDGVDKEKFGAAYWRYAHTQMRGEAMFGFTDEQGRLKVNGGVALLEYALSKDENEKHQGTGLYKLQPVTRRNPFGIYFEEWGIPDDIDNIELRLIGGGDSCVNVAKTTVSIGDKGLAALEADRKNSKETMTLAQGQSPHMQKLITQVISKSNQLSELCEQFMQDEGIEEDTVPS